MLVEAILRAGHSPGADVGISLDGLQVTRPSLEDSSVGSGTLELTLIDSHQPRSKTSSRSLMS